VTTSPPGTTETKAGVFGSPVLFGDSIVNGGARSGGRLDTGFWFDDEHIFGFQADFFILAAKAADFSDSSAGNPILARPFLNADTGAPNAELVAFPGVLKGTIQATATSSNLLGNDLLLRENLGAGSWYRFDFIGGFRYLHYGDGLGLTENLTTLSSPLVTPGTNIVVSDVFHATNDFYACEWGFTGEARWDRWVLTGLAKVAVGYDNEEVAISGSTTTTVPGSPPATNVGGLLALSSNIGAQRGGQWTAIPEFGLRVGYQVNTHVRAFAGYTLLYWPEAVRAADQVNLSLSPALIPGIGGGAGQFPSFNLHNSDIWAQGIDFGVEFRF
jgi:hypothetical protein